jgi:hypothetical protein
VKYTDGKPGLLQQSDSYVDIVFPILTEDGGGPMCDLEEAFDVSIAILLLFLHVTDICLGYPTQLDEPEEEEREDNKRKILLALLMTNY